MTRIAVLSDIHGNVHALRTVLDAVEEYAVDVVVNLGDIASGAVEPRATLDLLQRHPDIVTVRGNHERQLLTLSPSAMGGVDRIAHTALTDHDRSWLASLPLTAHPLPGVLMFHGSPQDDLCYLLETVEPTVFREATDADVIARLGDAYGRYRLFLCGHTHLQRIRHLPDGSLVVNPGSVGWPAYADDQPHPHRVQAGSPHARFTIVDDATGTWTADPQAVVYDHDAAATRANAHGRHDIASALRTGTVSDPAPA